MTFRQPQPSQNLFCSLTLNLIFLARIRQTGRLMGWSDGVLASRRFVSQSDTPLLLALSRRCSQANAHSETGFFGGLPLKLVPQALLMPVRLHAFATLVFGNFCFPSFFKRAHSDFENCEC